MHDATEGGVLGALDEMAHASTKAFVVDTNSILVSEETKSVCSAFGIDPLTSLSEGTMLLTCRPGRVNKLREKMLGSGLRIADVGFVETGTGLWLNREEGLTVLLVTHQLRMLHGLASAVLWVQDGRVARRRVEDLMAGAVALGLQPDA